VEVQIMRFIQPLFVDKALGTMLGLESGQIRYSLALALFQHNRNSKIKIMISGVDLAKEIIQVCTAKGNTTLCENHIPHLLYDLQK